MVTLMLISTIAIISQKTITVEIGSTIIRSKGARVAGSNGSIMQKTGKELPTGITTQPKNTTRGLQHKLPRAMHTVDGLNRGTAEGRVR
jgi:hypothetical protein